MLKDNTVQDIALCLEGLEHEATTLTVIYFGFDFRSSEAGIQRFKREINE